MNTDSKKQKINDENEQDHSDVKEQQQEENDIQDGLTGESDDEEDVSGDLAGNAGGNN